MPVTATPRVTSRRNALLVAVLAAIAFALFTPISAHASESSLVLPNLYDDSKFSFLGLSGGTLLTVGLLVCIGGLAFGLYFYKQVEKLPVHSSMLEISELIYET